MSAMTYVGLLVSVLAVGLSPQIDDETRLRLEVELTWAELRALVDVALDAGLPNVGTITTKKYRGPRSRSCEVVIVESKHTLDGHVVRWRELELRREDWEPCFPEASRQPVDEPSVWRRRSQARDVSRWRVVDGEWSLELPPPERVDYETFAEIVRALHRRRVRDVRYFPELGGDPIEIEPTPAMRIRASSPTDGARFQLYFDGRGSGSIFDVLLVDDEVHVVGRSFWIE